MPTDLAQHVIIAQQAQALIRACGNRLWAGWGDLPLAVGVQQQSRLWLVGHPSPPANFSICESLPYGPLPAEPRSEVMVLAGVETALLLPIPAAPADLLLTTLGRLFHSYQLHYTKHLAHPPSPQVSLVCFQDQSIRTLLHHVGYSLWRSGSALSDQELRYEADAIQALRQVLAELLAMKTGSGATWAYFTWLEWRLGGARYAALKIIEAASSATLEPAYAALADAETPEQLWARAWQQYAQELRDVGLEPVDNASLAALGYGLALLLDRVKPQWRQHYLETTLDQLLP
ncbi:MAG: hypothetical protein HY335_05110 [Deinococcus sp.]|nr:hypothetical protein [Deinococcus sp.]